jgi:peptide/nickel transport system permease protein
VAKFIIRRLIAGVLTLLAATVVVFTLSRLIGDPRNLYAKPEGYGISPEQYEALGKKLNLDKPLVVQYVMWLGKVMRGDFGLTLFSEKPVRDAIVEKLPNTLQLGLVSWVLAALIGVPIGTLSAVRRGTIWDYLGRMMAVLGQTFPQFWLGIMGILIFAVKLDWLPSATKGPPGATFTQELRYFVMPMVVLGWAAAAGYARITRSAMLEVLDSEYVKLARAKGLPGWRVISKHAFRNALIPPLTLSALLLANFLSGAVVVEAVFAWPGLGGLAAQAVYSNDFPVLTATVLVFAALFVTVNFAADLLYAVVDPRIRYT